MVLMKALLTGLVGASLCMANISGIVTDTGTTPIAGAVVQLETGGQTATTGADGQFTLDVTTAILPGNSKSLLNGLTARISGNMLNVRLAEQSAVEVATFDLTGKALSTVRKTCDAGSHSIALPYRGTGIYLYKLKSGNRELLFKGNSVGGVSAGSAVSSQVSLQNSQAKQSKRMAAINDVIAVIIEGYLNYRCVIENPDTSGIVIKMIANAGNVTDADGNVYQTVKIGKQVWTVDNLRTTRYNDSTPIPFDTATTTWAYAKTPLYCFYNNTTDAESIKKYGALYNWFVVNPANPKKIAPTGWHVPEDTEWTTLEKYLVLNGYNWDGSEYNEETNKLAKSLAAKTDWYTSTDSGETGNNLATNNSSGFSALPSGNRNYIGYFYYQSRSGFWWSTTKYGVSDAYCHILNNVSDVLFRNTFYKNCGFSVRLVRD